MPVRTTDDPLDEVLKPPPDESPEDRAIRLQNEAEAKRVSLAIDASIKAERHARRKKRIVRLLLLGQSESGELRYRFTPLVLMRVCVPGKSTTLRRTLFFFSRRYESLSDTTLQNFNDCIRPLPFARNVSSGAPLSSSTLSGQYAPSSMR
jgi:hypothetical protein